MDNTQDIVDVILADHELIRSLMRDFEASEPGENRRDTWQALVRTLAVHETAEEEIAYPRVRLSVEGGDKLVEPRLAEEDKAKKALADLEKMDVDSTEFWSRYREVASEILAHAEAEERDVWPRLRATVDDKMLQTMAGAFHAAKAVAPTHPHKLAPESAVGNIALGPVVAIIDRVRDAARDAMQKSSD